MIPRNAPRTATVCLSLLLFLSGCGRAGVTFIADPFLLETYGPEEELRRAVSGAADASGTRVDVAYVTGTSTLLDDVRAAIAKSGSRAIMLGPLLLDGLPDLMVEFPETTFIVPGSYSSYEPPSDDPGNPPRYVIVTFDRAGAYRRAGWLFAEKLKEADPPASSTNGGAAAVFLTGSVSRKHEMEAFVEGYESAEAPTPLNVKEVSSLRRVEELQFAIDRLLSENAGAVFLSVGALNADAFELLSGEPLYVAGERAEGSAVPADRLLFSIEDDFFEAVKKGLEAFKRGERGVKELEPGIVDRGIRASFIPPEHPEETVVQ